MQNHFIFKSLTELKSVIEAIPQDAYISPLASIGNSSIGEHVRHIINMYQCLEDGLESGLVNYDKRNRDKSIQENPLLACKAISDIIRKYRRPDKDLVLASDHLMPDTIMKTCYHRELIYCTEHCIHHQALIKVALRELGLGSIAGPEFGVAPSTIAFKNHVHG